jgi:hypothetical protein
MSDIEVPSAAEGVPGLSQWQRIVNTFTAPSKTFEDIKRGNRSWWMPFIISILAGYVLFAGITLKIGWAQVAENMVHLNPAVEESLAQAPAAQREGTLKGMHYGTEIGFAVNPILVLAIVALGSLLLMGTINFVFGGKATFGSIFVVWMYAGLPGIIKALLGSVVIFAGMAPESFNLNNFAPTSIGAFLTQPETNAALYKFASWLDGTTIWTMILLAIGIASVAKVKRGAGYITVFGWWTLGLLVSVGWAAIHG